MRKIAGMIGLCMRAGRLVTGLDSADQAARRGSAKLLLIDQGASNNAKKVISDASLYTSVPYRALPEGLLSQAAGKDGRMAAAVMDQGFADKLTDLIDTHMD